MDSRRMIVALVASVAAFYLYIFIVNRYFPPTAPVATRPAASRPVGADETSRPEPPASRPVGPGEAGPAPEVGSRPAAATRAAGDLPVEGGRGGEPIPLGAALAGNPYPMALQILPRGATVAKAEIRDHYMTVEKEQPYVVLAPMTLPDGTGRRETFHSFATPRIRFENLQREARLDGVDWEVVEQSAHQVALAVTVKTPEGAPLARVVKTYRLAEQPAQPRSRASTYDLEMTLAVENLTSDAQDVIVIQQGPVGFRKEEPRREDRRVVIARWEKDKFVSKGAYRSEVLKNGGKIVSRDDDAERVRVAWAAETNKYFACIMAPAGRLGPQDAPLLARVEPAALRESATGHEEDLTFRFITAPLSIAAGQSRRIGFDCYIGPKSKAAFEAVESYRLRNYYEIITESFYICAPNALVGLMMVLLDWFHRIWPHNYGVAIIILVLVVRVLLHPLTKKSQVNMMKMQQQQASLKPKLDAIREKYANDRVKQNQATMDLYREEGLNPAGSVLSCLPMFLQLPIWAALWTALASTIEMRHAALDPWWVRDLASPDAVYNLRHPFEIPLLSYLMGGPLESINLLPVLLCVSQMLQAQFMPKSQPAQSTEGAPDQRKMMLFMSFFFMFMLWNAPSGLNLYIMASNFFGIAEQSRIRKHLKEIESRREEEAARRRAKAQTRKKSWLQEKWQALAREADEARKVHSAREKRR